MQQLTGFLHRLWADPMFHMAIGIAVGSTLIFFVGLITGYRTFPESPRDRLFIILLVLLVQFAVIFGTYEHWRRSQPPGRYGQDAMRYRLIDLASSPVAISPCYAPDHVHYRAQHRSQRERQHDPAWYAQ